MFKVIKIDHSLLAARHNVVLKPSPSPNLRATPQNHQLNQAAIESLHQLVTGREESRLIQDYAHCRYRFSLLPMSRFRELKTGCGGEILYYSRLTPK
jgi:hypothetical protein